MAVCPNGHDSVSDDFYVNMNHSTEMELPNNRETILHYFERICREMCKNPDFMLPYWNYASNIGSSLQLPDPFVDQSSRLIFDDRIV